jgi:hypothetical protein
VMGANSVGPAVSSTNRRHFLIKAGTFSGLVWTAPIVHSVGLAHAQAGSPPPPSTTRPPPEPSACESIAVNERLVNGFSLPGRPYDEGDVLVVTAGFPAGSPPPTTIEMIVERDDVQGNRFVTQADFPNTLSFTFPATGIYFVQVTVNGGANASFTAGCSPSEA